MFSSILHDMILSDSTQDNPKPAVIREILDDYKGGGAIVFMVNTLVSSSVISDSDLVEGMLYDSEGRHSAGLPEDLLNSLRLIPGVDTVTLGAPSAYSLQVTKKPSFSWEQVTLDVIEIMCLMFEGWMESAVTLIDPVNVPQWAATVSECEFTEREINLYNLLLG